MLAAAGLAAGAWLTGARLDDLLGNYAVTTEGDLFPPGLARAVAVHLDWVVVGIGVLPLVFSLAFALRGLIRPEAHSERVFAVLGALTVAAMTVQVTSFNLRFAPGGIVQDRYLFYIAPILLVGMALAVERRIHPGWVAAAVVPVGWLIGLATYESNQTAFFAQPAVVFHRVLDGEVWRIGHWFGFDDLTPTQFFKYVPGALALLGAFALRSRWRAAAAAILMLGVLAYGIAETRYTFHRVVDDRDPSVSALSGAPYATDWIDAAVGDDVVGMVPFSAYAAYPPALWWNTEFWNKAVERSYSYESAETYTPFATSAIVLSPRTGRLSSPDGLPDYLVLHDLDLRFRPAGEPVAGELDLSLYRLRRPPRALATARGLGYHGVIQKGAGLTVFGPSGSRPRVVALEVSLIASPETDPALPRAAQQHRKYELVAGSDTQSGSLAPGQKGTARVDMCISPRRSFGVKLLSTGSGYYGASPEEKGLPIGVRVSDFRTRTLDRSCQPGSSSQSSRSPHNVPSEARSIRRSSGSASAGSKTS